MSSFWNFFSDKKEEEPSDEEQAPEEESVGGADATGQAPPASPPEIQMKAPALETKVKSMPPPPKSPRYGIDDAIRLMRSLPVDENVDLVVRVIKRTLESLSVRVPDILEDAGKRQESLRTKIAEHQAAIVQLEREIDSRRFEISRLEDDLAETTLVRERLQLAEATPFVPTPNPGETKSAPPASAAAANKKVDLSASQRSNAPPLPASFRPKPPAEPVKKAVEAIPVVGTDDDDDEQPVESKDMVDKG